MSPIPKLSYKADPYFNQIGNWYLQRAASLQNVSDRYYAYVHAKPPSDQLAL